MNKLEPKEKKWLNKKKEMMLCKTEGCEILFKVSIMEFKL